MIKKLILSSLLLIGLFLGLCFFGLPKTILKANSLGPTGSSSYDYYNWTLGLRPDSYRIKSFSTNETTMKSRLIYLCEQILDDNYYQGFSFYKEDNTGYRYNYNQIRLDINDDDYWLYAYNTETEDYSSIMEYFPMIDEFTLWSDVYYTANSSIVLDGVINYFFQVDRLIESGWYSFLSNNSMNISGISSSQTHFFYCTGLTKHVYEITGSSDPFIVGLQFAVNGNGSNFGFAYTYTDILYSTDPPYQTYDLKQIYFDRQYIDAVLYEYLMQNGAFTYVELPQEPKSVFELLDAFVAIPINLTSKMLNWSALGVNLLVALGTVLVIIVGFKVVRLFL